MSNRSVTRACVFGLALLAMVVGAGRPMLTLLAVEGAGQEFILCAPEDRIAAIAARHGLTIVRPLDDHMRGVVLVRGPVPRQQTNAILAFARRPDAAAHSASSIGRRRRAFRRQWRVRHHGTRR
jgi:hypothetical protein